MNKFSFLIPGCVFGYLLMIPGQALAAGDAAPPPGAIKVNPLKMQDCIEYFETKSGLYCTTSESSAPQKTPPQTKPTQRTPEYYPPSDNSGSTPDSMSKRKPNVYDELPDNPNMEFLGFTMVHKDWKILGSGPLAGGGKQIMWGPPGSGTTPQELLTVMFYPGLQEKVKPRDQMVQMLTMAQQRGLQSSECIVFRTTDKEAFFELNNTQRKQDELIRILKGNIAMHVLIYTHAKGMIPSSKKSEWMQSLGGATIQSGNPMQE